MPCDVSKHHFNHCCKYLYLHECIYVHMYSCMYVRMYAPTACMYMCVYVYICMHVCKYVCQLLLTCRNSIIYVVLQQENKPNIYTILIHNLSVLMIKIMCWLHHLCKRQAEL